MSTPAVTAHVYAYRGRFFVPTVAKTEAGFFLEVDPVDIVEVPRADVLAAAIESAMARGNPTVPTPQRSQYGTPVLVRSAEALSWAEFEKEARLWRIESRAEGWTLVPTRRAAGRGLEDDGGRREHIPPRDSTSVGRRILELARRDEIRYS